MVLMRNKNPSSIIKYCSLSRTLVVNQNPLLSAEDKEVGSKVWFRVQIIRAVPEGIIL